MRGGVYHAGVPPETGHRAFNEKGHMSIPLKNTGLLPPEKLKAARQLFPLTAKGMIYLNHAGTSPLSTRVVGAMTQYLHERSEGTLETYPSDIAMVARTKSLIASMINAESADRIALCPSTTDAINIVAGGVQWRSGDRILLNSAEFPANVWPFLNARRFGVGIDTIPSADGRVTPEMMERALTPRTRLVGLSAVQFLSGYRADLAAIGAICRQRGVIFAVDGIQAVGAVRVDVREMHIDALSAGGQKWQMAPHGSGFLYLTEQLQEQIRQASLGWLGVAEPWEFYNFSQPLAQTARRYEGGSLVMPSLWGMNAALSTLMEFGLIDVESHILALTGLLIERLTAVAGIRLSTPAEPKRRAGIVTFDPPPGIDPESILATLGKRGITVAVREGKIRISPHFYNSPEEMELTVQRLVESFAAPGTRVQTP